jgi:hypothetical protein
MVASVQVAVGNREQVTDLAVGVVDHRVEGGHLAQPGVVRAAGQGHQVNPVVNLDPQLAHARAERAVPHYRRRDDIPSAGPRDHVGRHLAPGKGPGREVPERALPGHRLVDARRLGPAPLDGAVQGGIRRVNQAPLHLERAALEELERGALRVGDLSRRRTFRHQASQTSRVWRIAARNGHQRP